MHDHAILQMANQISIWLAILSEQIFFLILYTGNGLEINKTQKSIVL